MNEPPFEQFVPRILYQVFRRCNPDWRISPQITDTFGITYIVKGKARYTIDGVAYKVGEGSLISFPKGVEIEAVTPPNDLMRCFAVNFDHEYNRFTNPPRLVS